MSVPAAQDFPLLACLRHADRSLVPRLDGDALRVDRPLVIVRLPSPIGLILSGVRPIRDTPATPALVDQPMRPG